MDGIPINIKAPTPVAVTVPLPKSENVSFIVSITVLLLFDLNARKSNNFVCKVIILIKYNVTSADKITVKIVATISILEPNIALISNLGTNSQTVFIDVISRLRHSPTSL